MLQALFSCSQHLKGTEPKCLIVNFNFKMGKSIDKYTACTLACTTNNPSQLIYKIKNW